jgi:hypothetical protein
MEVAVDEAFGFLVMQVATHPILTHVGYAGQRSRYTAPWLAEPHAGDSLRGHRWCRPEQRTRPHRTPAERYPMIGSCIYGAPFCVSYRRSHVRCGTSETCRSLSGQRGSPAMRAWHYWQQASAGTRVAAPTSRFGELRARSIAS